MCLVKSILWSWLFFLTVPNYLSGHGELAIEIDQVSEQIAATPNKPHLYLKRGQLLAQHLEFEAAQKDLRQARALAPNLYITDLIMAQILTALHQSDAALSFINRFLDNLPNEALGLIARSSIYHQLKQEKAAEKDLALALDLLKAPAPKHYIAIAEACLRADSTDLSTALSWLHKGQARFGFDIVLKEKEVTLVVKAKDYNTAIHLIDTLIPKLPRPEQWLFKKGTIYEASKKFKLAKEMYKATLQAIEILPKHVQMTKKMLMLEAATLLKIQDLRE